MELLREKCFINGEWQEAQDGKVITVTNPANGDIIGKVPYMGQKETALAIDSAEKAWHGWKTLTAAQRSDILINLYNLIIENRHELARIMTLEQGKVLAESETEIVYGASFIQWFAEEGKRIYGDVIPSHQKDKRILVLKQPIGVVAAITPWNFPNAMITRKAGPALACGCPIIVKPASQTPFSALAIAALAQIAGIPPGVFNVITGSSYDIGKEMTQNPKVRKLTFTGSTEVGKKLMADCAATVKKISLELGGNAPFIVFADADLDEAVKGAIMSKFRNSGQTCVCTNRIYADDKIYDRFNDKMKQEMNNLKTGDGLEQGVTQGPLINQEAVDKAIEHIKDATDKGAKIALGGKKHPLGGNFFEPTLLTEATPNMLIAHEETFAPVAPVFRFSSEEEVIKMANASPFGLAAYLYTNDLSRSWRVSEALEAGIVGLNTGIISTAVAPFGGVKESGIGREGSHYGIEDFLEIKYICLGNV